MSTEQNYSNHTRWFPLVHFILFPLLLVSLILALVNIAESFDVISLLLLLLAVILVLLNLAARMQSLRAQDRLIKLEEKLRYRELLSTDLFGRTAALRTGQIIALRFASDEELPALIESVLSGELTTSKEIKTAIKNWRGDYLRV